jgi:Zn-dependent protease with chaperone function
VCIVLFGLTLDYCPQTQGIWLAGGELEKLPGVDASKLAIAIDPFAAVAAGLPALPNLFVSTGIMIAGLYGILILLLIVCVEFLGLELDWALLIGVIFAALHFIFGPWVMDLVLRLFYSIRWLEPSELPAGVNVFVAKTCEAVGIKFPRFGLILDGAPQAFTYGHHPDNARIIVSQGAFDLLNPDEVEAVVAHEIGHAKHWDMLVMTLVGLVPLVLYYIYRSLIAMKSGLRGKGAGARYIVAMGAYILYILSEYLVLWFSRVREYYADRFSGLATNSPSALAQALVKIGYGLAGQKMAARLEARRRPQTEAIGSLGIFDHRSACMLAVSGYSSKSMGGSVNKELLKDAMKWDLWNPWALYYELHSTHPLIAKRLDRLSIQAKAQGKEPYIVFDRQRPESYWDDFLVDLLVKYLPFVSVVVAAVLFFPFAKINPVKYGSLVTVAFGLGYLGCTWLSYVNTEFPELTIASLLRKVKVSAVRPVPVTVRGTIIGRGVPGLLWSEDFILQDETGILFLDYRQPLGLWEFFFGLLRAQSYMFESVVVEGWYRRSPVPFIEIKTLTDSHGQRLRSYVYPVKLAVAGMVIAAGLIFFLKALFST